MEKLDTNKISIRALGGGWGGGIKLLFLRFQEMNVWTKEKQLPHDFDTQEPTST